MMTREGDSTPLFHPAGLSSLLVPIKAHKVSKRISDDAGDILANINEVLTGEAENRLEAVHTLDIYSQ